MLTIIDYFQDGRQHHWLGQIARYAWSAAKFLTRLLREGSFHDALGEGALYLLTDGDALVSFLTLAERDCIDEPAWSPWIGFVHTAPEYRGHRYAGWLIEHACAVAQQHGAQQVYICTDHDGLYEKYGFRMLADRLSIYGEMSHVLVRRLGDITYAPLAAEELSDHTFDGFIRYQKVEAGWRQVDGAWTLLPADYIVYWSPETLVQRVNYVRSVLEKGGWCIAAKQGERIVGHALLGHRLGRCNQYIDLESFQVSPPWRGRGIGKRLFSLACEEARRRGAQKLYISAHSAQETIAAYFALGCTHAAEIDPQHAADELCDMQLEYDLMKE